MSTTLSKHVSLRAVYPRPLVLYKHLLRQSKMFFDDATQYYFIKTIRHEFRKHSGLTNRDDINERLGEALTHLKRLVRANAGYKPDAISILGFTYGFLGPVISLRNKFRVGKQFLALQQSAQGVPFLPIKWGVPANHTAYPVHPRVLASFDTNPVPFMQELLRYTATLTREHRRLYRQWSELSWLPREPVLLHKPDEWSDSDIAEKRLMAGIDKTPKKVTSSRNPRSKVIIGPHAHIHLDYFPMGKNAMKNPAHVLPIPELKLVP